MRPPIEEIEVREQRATEGSWEIEYDNDGNGSFREWYIAGPSQIDVVSNKKTQAEDDAHFIAHARQDIPALLEYIKELEVAIAEYVETVGFNEGEDFISYMTEGRSHEIIKSLAEGNCEHGWEVMPANGPIVEPFHRCQKCGAIKAIELEGK